ncbi:hypothetical protein DAPK24_017610 [Pichia kluyveri]|uniref:Uncharacterized protein n=1 Tax=Pichia kluyveri TaxID=36015 RepID=A0AAV5R1M8_PICKL|nr:hypothetical protein DAPK24_017610 [Pichia kluyveri]
MFAPSTSPNSGDYGDYREYQDYGELEFDGPEYFKDPDSMNSKDTHSNSYKQNSGGDNNSNIFNGIRNPFIKGSDNMFKTNNPVTFNKNAIRPGFAAGSANYRTVIEKNSGSSTCFSSENDFYNKEKYNPLTSVSTERLIIARKQIIMKSYFKSFKILSLITLILFACPIISLICEMSCISKEGLCLPKFEIQTSGKENYITGFNIFQMQKVGKGSNKISSEVSDIFETIINGLSGLILDSSFNKDLIKQSIDNIFNNKNDIIFKISNFGYCKEMFNGVSTFSECHLISKGKGTDLVGVILKDLIYTLSSMEIEGDAEYISNLFVDKYQVMIKNLHTGDNKYLMYGYLSLLLGEMNSIKSIIGIVIESTCLLMSIIITVYFKDECNKKLNLFKEYLFDKKYREEESDKFSISITIINIIIKMIGFLILVNLLLKISGVIYEIGYIITIKKLIEENQLNIINGIKVISKGMILEIFNIVSQLTVLILLIVCVISKPWIIKIII